MGKNKENKRKIVKTRGLEYKPLNKANLQIQRNSGKPPKNFESSGNDILGGGFDLGAFEPK